MPVGQVWRGQPLYLVGGRDLEHPQHAQHIAAQPVRRSRLIRLALARHHARPPIDRVRPPSGRRPPAAEETGPPNPRISSTGVTQLTVTATGAAGQNGTNGGAGGNGATVTGTVPATPGNTLYVNVNTGGGGGGAVLPGGTGGGSSDVRTCSSANVSCVLTGVPGTAPRLIVAGGGGGGGRGAFLNPEFTGGDAGDTGQPGGDRPLGAVGGGGGTQTAGGTGGATCPLSPTTAGTDGAAGTGGTGGEGFGGGGGGGGWFGGGGGGGSLI
ncbi:MULTISPECIES: hypothetical protein [unclassified Streptomyces]|uniref:hypothetical protein n=1 Tax=unclassified Streptomyces TaxID=2593676 RepID=UPI0022550DC8|nr:MULTISPECIES: hypothetical protein [unclassified Streptomyces]MCX4648118.1 hypothetical protein [Streptomyces sp. NBC_01446]MCX5323762.1 hypothetical protein [Streptomyces sp. NBC_00120]